MPIAAEVRSELLDAPSSGYHSLAQAPSTSRASSSSPFSPIHQPVDDTVLAQWWRDYKLKGCLTARTQLIVHFMAGHVRGVADRLSAQLPRQVDLEDLVQSAYPGLVGCVDSFDIAKGVKFETYSTRRLKGAMRDYLRDLDDLPRLARFRFKFMQNIREDFYKRHGRDPSEEELRSRLQELTPRKFRRIMADAHPALMLSFSGAGARSWGAAAGNAADDSDAMQSFEDDRSASPLSKAEREDLKRWITTGFSRRDRLIIILYYYEQMTMKDIGQTLGCSESRVSQRLDAIIKSLRARLKRIGGRQLLMVK